MHCGITYACVVQLFGDLIQKWGMPDARNVLVNTNPIGARRDRNTHVLLSPARRGVLQNSMPIGTTPARGGEFHNIDIHA